MSNTVYNPPMWYFVPSQAILHPETRQPVLEKGVAYSLAAFEQKCDETGIDMVKGLMVDINAARHLRKTGKVTRFVILKREDKE